MKYKVLRLLVSFRKYANTEKGEQTIVRVLTSALVVLIVCSVLLVFG